MANSGKFNTEFGDDIIIKVSIPDASEGDNANVEYVVGRMDTLRFEETEEYREVRGIGSKFRVEGRTTRFRGTVRCSFKPTQINMAIFQYTLGAKVPQGQEINDQVTSLLMSKIYSDGIDTYKSTNDSRNFYVAPYDFTIEAFNIRKNVKSIFYGVKFTRRSKSINEGDYSVIELEGEYDYAIHSSDIFNIPISTT